MKKGVFQLIGLLLLLPLFAGCNESDDVAAIFTGKTWKLNFIAVDGQYEMVDFWDKNDTRRKASLEELNKPGTYNVVFEGTVEDDVISGKIKGTVVGGYSLEGTWSANSKNNSFKANVTGNDGGDILAKNFLEGLNNATSYDGDIKNLYILYKPKESQRTFRIYLRTVNN